MLIVQQLITFGASAQQFPAPPAGEGLEVCRVYAEPLRANTAASFIGVSSVVNTTTGVGVIRELAIPGATNTPLDSFDHRDEASANTIDPTQFYGHGTSGQILKVTYFIR